MKIFELYNFDIKEAKEYLDPDRYGGWMNENGEIHHVSYEDHANWIIDNLAPDLDIDENDFFYDWDKIYNIAYDKGWIRFVFEEDGLYDQSGYSLNLQGNWKNIRKAFKYWRSTAFKANSVYITSKHRVNNKNKTRNMTFKMPKDREKLMTTIKDVTESAMGGSTSAGSIASVPNPVRGLGLIRRSGPSLFGYTEPTKKKKRKKKK